MKNKLGDVLKLVVVDRLMEMAEPTCPIKEKMWYHGTNEEGAKGMMESGYLKPSSKVTAKSRGAMDPVFNKIYLTADLNEAVRYALFRTDVDEVPYLIGVTGEALRDIQPDEDVIADLLQTDKTIKGFEWLIPIAKRIDNKLYNLFKREGDYEYSVRLAKKMVNVLSDEQKIDLINKGMKIAHSGAIPVSHVWQLPPLEDRMDSMIGKDINYYICNRYKIY